MRLSRESSRPARPARATVHVALAVTAGGLPFLLSHRVWASRVRCYRPRLDSALVMSGAAGGLFPPVLFSRWR
jgi:hypothetical protein